MACYLSLVFYLQIWPWVEILGSCGVSSDNDDFAGWSTNFWSSFIQIVLENGHLLCSYYQASLICRTLREHNWSLRLCDLLYFFYSVHHLPCSQRFARVIVMKRIVSLLLIWLWILEVKLSVFVLGSALETDCRNVSWMCLVQLVFFKILLVYTIKTKVEVKHSASSKDLLHIKIKGNVMFKGVKIVFAFPGLCCILKDHKGQA